MRILHICHDYWPAVGGSELLLKEVSERLVAWGEEVSILTSNAPCTEAFVNPTLPLLTAGKEIIGGVPVKRFRISRRFRRPLNLLMQTAWRLRLPFNDLVRTFWNGPTCPRMIYEIARAKPDLVVATAFPFQTMYYPFVARFFHPFPIVLIPCFHPADPWSFDRPIMEKALKAADAVIVLTEYEREHLLSMGVEGEKLHVVGVGTDPECIKGIDRSAFRTKRGIGGADPMIAFVGRMEPGKGVETLLDAMPRVWRVIPTARLVLAGPSTYYSSAVNAKVAALPREAHGRVLLLGIISEEEKRELLVACDLLALPSRVESFGIVYLEAWACGKPVIGCRTGAVSSVIEDEGDGLLVTYGDAGELAGAIIRLLSDEPTRQRLGEKGRAKVLDRYNWDRIAKEMRELYRRLLEEKGYAARRAQRAEDRANVHETQGDGAYGSPLVSVVIVCTNDRQHMAECLGSLQDSTYPDIEVIVADNGSTDGSVEFIRRTFPSVKVIEMGKNLGFPEANNRGGRIAQGKYIFQLNPDTRIDSRCIEELVRAMEVDESIGVAAAKMKIYFEPEVLNSVGIVANQILYACDRGAFELDRGQYDTPTEVIAGCGGALMVRRSLIEQIGELDARFFMYYEDFDFGIRTWLSGNRVLFIPQAIVYHKYKAGIRKAIYNEYYDHRNRLRTMLKNFSLATLTRMLPASLIFNGEVIAKYIAVGRMRDALYQLRAIFWNLAVLPGTLRERRKVQRLRQVPDEVILRRLVPQTGYPRLQAPAPDYGVTYVATTAAASMEPAIDMGRNDVRQLGLGWFPLERDGGIAFRWTTNYAVAFLHNPLEDGAEKCVLELHCCSSVFTRGQLLVQDRDAGEFAVEGGRWQTLRMEVETGARVLRLTLLPKANLEEGGGRLMGIAVSSIRLAKKELKPTLYERSWDAYSAGWEERAGRHLGDKWGSETFTQAIFERFCLPYLGDDKAVLEIGPGGGKYSVLLAPRCKVLYAADVSQAMLDRTARRLKGCDRVQYVKLNGLDYSGVPADSFDVVFSFDAFVHLDTEEIFWNLKEIQKVLKPGGMAVIHFANLLSPYGWEKFVQEAGVNRGEQKQVGRFNFLTPQIIERFLEELKFRIDRIDTEINGRDFIAVFARLRPDSG